MHLELFVRGVPTTQGSKTPGVTKDGRLYTREVGGQRLKVWRETLFWEFRATRKKFEGEVSVMLKFLLVRPSQDIDKLARAVLDSMSQSGLIVDDRFVYRLYLEKERAPSKGEAGVYVEVDDELQLRRPEA